MRRRVKTIVHLDPEQRKVLEKLSERTGAPLAELIRRAVKQYLQKATK